MSEREQLQRSWVANATSWSDAVREQRIESRRVVTDAAIVEAVLAGHPRTSLDLGCGEGWLARALASHGIEVTGIDASAPLVDAANALGGARFLAIGYDALAQLGELLAVPRSASVPRSSSGDDELSSEELRGTPRNPRNPRNPGFDAIVANFSLLDDAVDAVLADAAQLLAPNGRLIVQTVHPAFADGPYADGWRTETFASFAGDWPEPMPWYFRTIESWSRAFAGAGLAIAEMREPVHPSRGTPASLIFVTGRSRVS